MSACMYLTLDTPMQSQISKSVFQIILLSARNIEPECGNSNLHEILMSLLPVKACFHLGCTYFVDLRIGTSDVYVR